MLGPIFWRDLDRHSRRQSRIDHGLIDAFGVQINLDAAATLADTVEDHSPEIIAAFGDAAFTMDAQGDAADGGTGLQQSRDRVPTVRAMGVAREAGDRIIWIGAVQPFVTVHPETEIELEAARNGLFADELQHFQIPVALGIGQLRNAHFITRHGEEEGICEEEIAVGDILKKIVANPEAEIEAVETLRGQ